MISSDERSISLHVEQEIARAIEDVGSWVLGTVIDKPLLDNECV